MFVGCFLLLQLLEFALSSGKYIMETDLVKVVDFMPKNSETN